MTKLQSAREIAQVLAARGWSRPSIAGFLAALEIVGPLASEPPEWCASAFAKALPARLARDPALVNRAFQRVPIFRPGPADSGKKSPSSEETRP